MSENLTFRLGFINLDILTGWLTSEKAVDLSGVKLTYVYEEVGQNDP